MSLGTWGRGRAGARVTSERKKYGERSVNASAVRTVTAAQKAH